MVGAIRLRLLCCAAMLLVMRAAAAAMPDTESVFDRFAAAVVQLRVVETGSNAKAVIGTGFYAGGPGDIVTNYHVISKVVQNPDRYRAERVGRDGITAPLRVLAIDVVHDVAVVRADEPGPLQLRAAQAVPAQGERLYSLGYPHDLGLTIVEGTYNGFLDHTLYEKIHFTGSINAGMSGGPTITAAGAVVGINVATAGNQVSFLVPVVRAEALLQQVAAPGYTPPSDWLAVVRQQLLDYQDAYFARLLDGPLPTESFEHFSLPGKIAPFFKCWGDAQRRDKQRHQMVSHACSTDDYLFISGDHLSGVIEYRHSVLTSKDLNPFQFFSLYSDLFAAGGGSMVGWMGSEEEVTRYRCETRVVEHDDTPLKAVFCLRAYRKLPGLYDATLKAAVLGGSRAGAETSLALAGVSFENAQRLTKRYLEAIAWTDR